MRYGFVKSYEDVVFCLDDQKLYLACVISGLVFKHHVFSIEGKALLIALTYSLVKGYLQLGWPAYSQFSAKFNIPACIDMERNLGAGGGDVGGISRWAESEMGDIFSVFG